MADDFASLARRLKALEQNRGAVLRWGTVTEVDEKAGSARVKINDADSIVTMPLRVLQRRTLKDQEQSLPDIGEQVACLFSGQGFEQGLVLGAAYSDKDPSPGWPPHVWYRKFEDGTEMEYDRKEHKLTLNVNGDMIIRASGTITINGAYVYIQEEN
ncbi:MAG: phage baseplate assembly protein V [Desulfobulbus sp.]|nr:phage baseplate assembly protein V [Desulfobulbus sp.]